MGAVVACFVRGHDVVFLFGADDRIVRHFEIASDNVSTQDTDRSKDSNGTT